MASVTPLSGIVVIEIGHSIAAPYAGMILGELGAEVIKVENPKGGDAARGWGPPFQEGASTCFHSVNRAKRGITIDLADPAGAARLRALILERADVVIHNLKYGALEKYGLGGVETIAAKPALVWCNLAAFGNTAWALRVPATIVGILTVVGVYFLGVELFSESIGLLAAFLIATSLWHVHFSRMG